MGVPRLTGHSKFCNEQMLDPLLSSKINWEPTWISTRQDNAAHAHKHGTIYALVGIVRTCLIWEGRGYL